MECFFSSFHGALLWRGKYLRASGTEAVERLEQTGTEIWRTADSGAVKVWTDGKRMYIKGYKKKDYGKERDKTDKKLIVNYTKIIG
ncbi:MAG: hypothetical protein ACLR8P_22565 [Clostridium fessum]